jgi:hypothetical protein
MGIGGDKNAIKMAGITRWMERIVLSFTNPFVGVVGGLGLELRLVKSNFQDDIISCCHIADASHPLRLHSCNVQPLRRRLNE